MAAAEISQTTDVTHVTDLPGGFRVGNMDARVLQPGQWDKSARRMLLQVHTLAQHLNLPFLGDERAHEVIRHANGNSFVGVEVGDGKYWVMARSPLDGRDVKDVIGSSTPHINVVSGPCLFSAHTAQAVTANGREFSLTSPGEEITEPITRLQIDSRLTTYEAEAALRLSSFINALARDNKHVDNIYLNIPQTEYYLYILDAYQGGLVSPELAKEWFGAVDARHQTLASIMRKRVSKGVTHGAHVVEETPLEPIRQYIHDTVAHGQHPDLQLAIDRLAQSSQLWADILAVEQPDTWHHLNYLGYIYAELHAGMSPNSNDRQTIAVAVENPIEERIFRQAKQLAPKLPDRGHHYNVIALYPHEAVVPTGDNEGALMYYLREGRSRIGNLRAAAGQYRRRE